MTGENNRWEEKIRTEIESSKNDLESFISVMKKELEQLEKLVKEKEYSCARTSSQEIEKWARRIYEKLDKIDFLTILLRK